MKYTIYVRGKIDVTTQMEVEADSLDAAYEMAEQDVGTLSLDEFDVEMWDVSEFDYSGSEPGETQ